MRTLVNHFRKIVRHHRWIQRPGIMLALLLKVLAFLAMVQQRRGPKMQGSSTHYLPTGSNLPVPITDTSVFRIRNGAPFHWTRKQKRSIRYIQISIECLCHNGIILHFYAISIAFAFPAIEKNENILV